MPPGSPRGVVKELFGHICLSRECPKLYRNHTGRTSGSPFWGSRCGSAFLFWKNEKILGKIWKFSIDRGRGLLYNIMMQLVWSFRPCGLSFDKIEVTF